VGGYWPVSRTPVRRRCRHLRPLLIGMTKISTGGPNIMNIDSLSRPSVDTLAGQRAAVGLSSLVFGLVFVYFVGFAPISAVHNAAHDTRHTAAFPCH
jgi:cobalt transporter subunit CbtB